MEIESRKQTDQLRLHEEKLKLNEIELKKKLEQSREELQNQYREILKERDRFEGSLDSLDDIVLTIDQMSQILYINKSGEKFWNVKLDKVRGKSATSLFPGFPEGYDTFIVSFLSPESTKITGEIKKLQMPAGKGKTQDIEILLSMAETEEEVSYTAFIRIL
jgi:transcriptional regulator with PAS, ATPase and Fis domain